MRFYSHIDVTGLAPPQPADRAEPRVLPWPLAVAIIGGISAGLWAVLYRAAGAIFGF